jgi:hypothetical protein
MKMKNATQLLPFAVTAFAYAAFTACQYTALPKAAFDWQQFIVGFVLLLAITAITTNNFRTAFRKTRMVDAADQ